MYMYIHWLGEGARPGPESETETRRRNRVVLSSLLAFVLLLLSCFMIIVIIIVSSSSSSIIIILILIIIPKPNGLVPSFQRAGAVDGVVVEPVVGAVGEEQHRLARLRRLSLSLSLSLSFSHLPCLHLKQQACN